MPTEGGRLTHLALPVSNLEQSSEFYQRWASMEVTGGVEEHLGARIVRLTDRDHSFALVLIEAPEVRPLAGVAHLGVSYSSREEINRLAGEAQQEGCLGIGAAERPDPLGFSAFLSDPDGHRVELYHGVHAGIAGG